MYWTELLRYALRYHVSAGGTLMGGGYLTSLSSTF